MANCVGFDRRLKLEWLDATASGTRKGKSVKDLSLSLGRLLEKEVKGTEARRKTTTVLLHIWGDADARTRDLRKQGLDMLAQIRTDEVLWLHWGMSLAKYPFFHDVASIIGKIARLQGSIRLSHLTRRITERWGERTTVGRALQRVVRTMIDWQVLAETGTPGLYEALEKRSTDSNDLMLWFIEALLIADSRGCVSIEELSTVPAAFPFDVTVSLRDIEGSTHLETQTEGARGPLVLLRQ